MSPNLALERGISVRDNHRDALYKAERAVFGSYDDPPAWHNAAELADLARSYETLPSVVGPLNGRRISTEVSTRSHRSRSWVSRMLVRMSSEQRAAWVLTHEVSHLLVAAAFPSHGREYATRYLNVARDVHGDEQADRLADAFTEAGVPFGPRPDGHADRVETTIMRGIRNDWPINLIHANGEEHLLMGRTKGVRMDEWVRVADGQIIWADPTWAATPPIERAANLSDIAYATVLRPAIGMPIVRSCRVCGGNFTSSGKRGRPPVTCQPCRVARLPQTVPVV